MISFQFQRRSEIEIYIWNVSERRNVLDALIFPYCGKNWFRCERRGGRSLQPAISNAWPRAFAIEKRSKDAIGRRKLAGGVHNWMKPMLNITRETHKYAEIIEEAPVRPTFSWLFSSSKRTTAKKPSPPHALLTRRFTSLRPGQGASFFLFPFSFFSSPFHARPWKSTIELNLSFVGKTKNEKKKNTERFNIPETTLTVHSGMRAQEQSVEPSWTVWFSWSWLGLDFLLRKRDGDEKREERC